MNSIGVDIGGTFTDLVGYRDGTLIISKTLTTPANPTLGVAKALNYRHGYFDQTGELWSPEGHLLASTHQLVYFKD